MLYFRSRFPLFYRFAALLALIAILVPAGTILTHNPATPQLYAHICGVDHPNGHHGKTPAHKMPVCPICQSLHLLSAGFVQPDVATAIDMAFVATSYLATFSEFLLKRAFAPQARSHAPPALA
jgi:hypothetical protein